MPNDLNILIFGGTKERYKSLKENIARNVEDHHFLIPCQDIFLASTLIQRYKVNGIIANVDKGHQIEVFKSIKESNQLPVIMISSDSKPDAENHTQWQSERGLSTHKNYLQIIEGMIKKKEALPSRFKISSSVRDLYYEYSLKSIIQSMINNLNTLFKKKIKANILMKSSLSITLKNYNVLFGVLTELIDNTFKHSKATVINIEAFQEGEHLFFSYSDNGMGVKKFRDKKVGKGLDSIKASVKAAKGKIRLTSKSLSGYHCKVILLNPPQTTRSAA